MKGVSLVSLVAALCVAPALVARAQADDARGEFVAAVEKIERREQLTEEADSAALRTYALYDYLVADRIVARLGDPAMREAAMRDARAFFDRFDGTPVGFVARRDAMAALSRADAWRELVDVYLPEAANLARECEYLRARVILGETADLVPLVERRWLTAERLPSACESAFQWLRETGGLDTELTERRVVLLLEQAQTDFARIVMRRLDATRVRQYQAWADMLDAPLETLEALAAGTSTATTSQAVEATWERATIRFPLDSFELFPELRRRLDMDAAQTSRFARSLALGLAWDRREEALRAFARVTREDLDDYALEWLARAAVWNGEWRIAADAVAGMSQEMRARSAWKYWDARSAAALGETSRARTTYAALSADDNFYAALAAARLGQPVSPHAVPVALNDDEIAALAEMPALVRARELLTLGKRADATREWRFGIASLAPRALAQAVALADRWGWHDMAVATATQAGIFNEYSLLYPQAYAPIVAEAAGASMLPQALLRGVLRQESLFRPDAVSEAGAVGLTQLLPATARRNVSALPPELREAPDLFDPRVNVLLGAATLRRLVDEFDGQTAIGLAAYNAGPAAAARWLPARPIDLDVWVENIPYNETRQYVRQVLWHSVVYAWQESGRAPQIDDWLGQVMPLQHR